MLLVPIIRRKELRIQQSNYEWELQLITQALRAGQNASNGLLQAGTDFEADTMVAKKLQQRQYKLKLLDEKLTIRKEEIETQLKAIAAEIKSCDEMINSSIQSAFTYSTH